MKRSVVSLTFCLACATTVRSQEIFDALRKGDIQIARAFVEKSPQVLENRDGNGMTPLHYAATGGSVELINYFVDLLLEKGARVPQSGLQWQGMLSQAASNGLTALFRRLTEGSKDLKSVDPSGVRLLHSAIGRKTLQEGKLVP